MLISIEPSIVKQLRKEEKDGFLIDNNEYHDPSYETDKKDFFKLAVDNSLDSIFLIDRKKMCFIDVNKTACLSTGYSKEELLNMGPQDIKPDFSKKKLIEKFDKLLNGNNKKGFIETVHKRKDGSTFPVEVYLSCLKDEDIIIASVRDISERIKLEKTKRDYKLLIESLNEGIWKIDKDSITTYVNKSMAKMLGYTVDEMIGKHLFSFMDDEGKKIAEENLKRREQGIDEQHDFEFIRKDGSRIYAILETTALLDDDGKYQGALAGVKDITERKKIEDKLKNSEESYKTIFNSSTDSICLHDLKTGKIIDVNQTTIEKFGYSKDEIKKLTIADLSLNKPPYTQKEAESWIKKAIRKGPQRFQWLSKAKDGSLIWHNISLQKVKINGIERILVIAKDITEDKKNLDKLEEARDIINLSSVVAFTWKNSKGWPVEYVSENVENVFGYSDIDFLSGNVEFEKCIHPQDLQRVMDEVEKNSKDLSKTSFEHEPYRIVTKDGDVKYVKDKSFIIRNADGSVTHFKGLIEDVTEKQKIINEIFETNEKYLTLVEKSNDGILIVQDKKFKFANKALSKITGFSVDELNGMSFLEAVADSEKERIVEIHMKRLKGEKVPDFYETKIRCKDGAEKPVELSVSTIDYQEKPAQLAFVRDISERKKFEEKVRQTEEKFRETTELLPETVYEITLDGSLKYANKVAFEKFGYSKKDFDNGLSVFDLISKKDHDRVKQNIAKILKGEKVDSNEYVALKKDGSNLDVEIYSSPIIDDGKPVGLRGVIVDVSERKKFEVELKKSEKKFRVLFDNSVDAIFIHKINDFSIIDVNKEACDRFGFTYDEMKKISIDDITHESMPSLNSKEAEIYIKKIMDGETITMEWLSKFKSGKTFWHEMKIKLVEIDGNKRILATARDINDRKSAENELKQKIEELERWKKVTVGRELQMKELKDKINKLENKK